MKSIRVLIFGIISYLLFVSNVSANSISSIEMDVYINNDGNAYITEVWKADLDSGTEAYRTFTNLGNSKIYDFKVVDQSGNVFKFVSDWKTNGSFSSKAYKNGFNYLNNGVELCFGISNYGSNIYTLTYRISNFVQQYTDVQGIYFNFLNFDQGIGNAKVTIRADYPFSLDNAKIWSFGNDGSIDFVNGMIVMDSDGYLYRNDYMVGLVRFEQNIFNVKIKSTKSFDQIYDEAMVGVAASEAERKNSIFDNLSRLFYIGMFFFVFVTCFRNRSYIVNTFNRSIDNLDFGINGKTLPKEVNYYREIPCNGDLLKAYWVLYNYNIVSTDLLHQGLVGAFLLKWIKEEKISIVPTKAGLFNIKDNDYAIDFSRMTQGENVIENKLFSMLKVASLNDILEAKEFNKWCKKNCSTLTSWFFSALYDTQIKLENEGLIIPGFDKNKRVKKVVSELLREEAILLNQLILSVCFFSDFDASESPIKL